MRRRLLIALAVAGVSAPAASAGDRILLDRSQAEFTAGFFAITRGAELDQDVHVNCRKRIALNVRRCRVSWSEGRHEYNGRLFVAAFEERADANRYRVRYKLRDLDLRCARVSGEDACTSVETGTETYAGS